VFRARARRAVDSGRSATNRAFSTSPSCEMRWASTPVVGLLLELVAIERP